MHNINLFLTLDFVLTIFPLIFAIRLLLLSKKSIPYKAGSDMYKLYVKSTSPNRIIAAFGIAVIFGIKTAFDIHQLINLYGSSALSQIGFLIGFVLLIGGSVAYGMYVNIKPH